MLDHLTQWSATGKQEQYAYDASGLRTLKRSTNGSTTTLTVYAFGLQEHAYTATGSNTSNTYYYSIGGRLLGSFNGTTTQFYLTDILGSVITSFSNTATSAAVLDNQVYGPYGNQRYAKGNVGTSKGFTGQDNDSLSGLDYYKARYYDPVAGVFLSADTAQGNGQGMNPYGYVGGSPETLSDPTGHYIPAPDGGQCYLHSGGHTCTQGSGGSGTPPAPEPKPTTKPGGNTGTNKPPNKGNTGLPAPKQPSKSPCLEECKTAANSLMQFYNRQKAGSLIFYDFFTLVVDVVNLLSDSAKGVLNQIMLALDLLSTIPHFLHLIVDVWSAFTGGTVPDWLRVIMIVGDTVATAANYVKGMINIVLGTWFNPISKLEDYVIKTGRDLAKSIILSFANAGVSGSILGSDVVDLEIYQLNNVWSPDEIIKHCKEASSNSSSHLAC